MNGGADSLTVINSKKIISEPSSNTHLVCCVHFWAKPLRKYIIASRHPQYRLNSKVGWIFSPCIVISLEWQMNLKTVEKATSFPKTAIYRLRRTGHDNYAQGTWYLEQEQKWTTLYSQCRKRYSILTSTIYRGGIAAKLESWGPVFSHW